MSASSVISLTTFARRLVEARRRYGVSQKQLGILAGLEPHLASPRINQYEKGTHEPRPEFVRSLAVTLGVPAAYFFTDDDQLSEILLRWKALSSPQRRAVQELVETFNPEE